MQNVTFFVFRARWIIGGNAVKIYRLAAPRHGSRSRRDAAGITVQT
jgi:hypothetical protein